MLIIRTLFIFANYSINSESDGKLGNHATTSQTAISHPAIANALPSRHLITAATQPHRQQSKTMAFLEPQLKKGSTSSVTGGKDVATKERRQVGTPVGSREAINLKNTQKDPHKIKGIVDKRLLSKWYGNEHMIFYTCRKRCANCPRQIHQ